MWYKIFISEKNNLYISYPGSKLKTFIPYLYHYNPTTIITKDNHLLSILKVEGFSSETADDEEIDIKKIFTNNKTTIVQNIVSKPITEIKVIKKEVGIVNFVFISKTFHL